MKSQDQAGKPVNQKIEKFTESIRTVLDGKQPSGLDFGDTEITFKDRSDKELRQMAWLYGMMNKHWLVGIGTKVGMTAIKLRLPFVEGIVKKTIFEQFCGGTTLLNAQPAIERLSQAGVLSILDYGAEGKDSEEEMNKTMNETIRAIEFAAPHEAVPMVSCKITGLARNGLLESLHRGDTLTSQEKQEYESVRKRIDSICNVASKTNVSVLIDAEESWMQQPIDDIVDLMMKRYNKERAVVYNTFQLYRKDRLQFLNDSYNKARDESYILGAKLVRGAYMDKERERAEEKGYPSPIQQNKQATDDAYNMAVRFCLDNIEHVACVNASHNAESNFLMAELIRKKGLPKDHPHLVFAQLYGMSDNLTYNLAHQGFLAAKYLVYGAVRDVIPYLIRRAEENSSVTGDMTRELSLVVKEMKRRGLKV